MGPHPIPNRLLAKALEDVIPGRASRCSISRRSRAPTARHARERAFVAAEHGRNLARGLVRPWQAFFSTTYMFRWMSRRARDWALAHEFDWTIQIQSLFDARAPGIPHFVYTDHTTSTISTIPTSIRARCTRRAGSRSSARCIARRGPSSRAARTCLHRSSTATAAIPRASSASARARTRGFRRIRSSDRPRARTSLFVGVDWERKGGPELLAAFERVRSSHPRATLTVVGCSPSVYAPGCRVLGGCPVGEVHRHYERADVFCLPTRREPFGVAFVEALHHGLPIVATRIGAVPDLGRARRERIPGRGRRRRRPGRRIFATAARPIRRCAGRMGRPASGAPDRTTPGAPCERIVERVRSVTRGGPTSSRHRPLEEGRLMASEELARS
jgi:glycosyltransferase involved in cell wall biosynthesis